ncbi:hypothetical protein ES703_119773 [subsurface metagenome]
MAAADMLIDFLQNGKADAVLRKMYGEKADVLQKQVKRYVGVIEGLAELLNLRRRKMNSSSHRLCFGVYAPVSRNGNSR